MTSKPETKDLLIAFAQEKEASSRRRRRLGWMLAGVFLVASCLEPAVNGTIWIVGGACLGLLGLVFLGLALGYSACIFMASWTYAHTVQDQGQTRPTWLQAFTILVLGTLGALPIAVFALQDAVDARFWMTLALIAWNNVLCGMLGYGVAFWTRLRPRAILPTLPIED